MRGIARRAVVILIGAATAWIWIRLGLYGFGLPVGLATLIPLVILTGLYTRTDRPRELGVLLGSFAAPWAAFETWTWLNGGSDPAVSYLGWTPIPLAAAVALLIIAGAVGVAAPSESR